MYIAMIFMHVMVDFKQGIIADLKCKSWWEKNYPDPKYEEDYIIALMLHAASWTFAIYIPPLIVAYVRGFNLDPYAALLFISYLANLAMHTIVDHLKANELVLNLEQDQKLHILQITITAFMFMVIFATLE
jgi:hypothetical protein